MRAMMFGVAVLVGCSVVKGSDQDLACAQAEQWVRDQLAPGEGGRDCHGTGTASGDREITVYACGDLVEIVPGALMELPIYINTSTTWMSKDEVMEREYDEDLLCRAAVVDGSWTITGCECTDPAPE